MAQGYLLLRVGKKDWQRYWFVLKNKCLYFLEAPPALGKTPSLCGLVSMEGLRVNDDPSPYCKEVKKWKDVQARPWSPSVLPNLQASCCQAASCPFTQKRAGVCARTRAPL